MGRREDGGEREGWGGGPGSRQAARLLALSRQQQEGWEWGRGWVGQKVGGALSSSPVTGPGRTGGREGWRGGARGRARGEGGPGPQGGGQDARGAPPFRRLPPPPRSNPPPHAPPTIPIAQAAMQCGLAGARSEVVGRETQVGQARVRGTKKKKRPAPALFYRSSLRATRASEPAPSVPQIPVPKVGPFGFPRIRAGEFARARAQGAPPPPSPSKQERAGAPFLPARGTPHSASARHSQLPSPVRNSSRAHALPVWSRQAVGSAHTVSR